MSAGSVLVVGAGLGGFHVAHALRRGGFPGEVTVLGAETHPPYDRPPLSKAFLAGRVTAADLALDDPANPLDVTWVPGTTAAELTPHGVRTTDGRQYDADAVVLAVGANAVRLDSPATGVHVLRTLEDAEALRADGVAGRDVVVIGMGFIGLEAAATATALGASAVTVVGVEPVPLAERFGAEVGAAVQSLHERHGVRFLGGAAVTGLRHDPGTGRVAGVDTDAGPVDGDLVIVGIGVRPATGWLQGADGLTLAGNGAVLCDTTGHTGRAGVWALGDCAIWAQAELPGLRRAGHWQDALDHAAVVAADVLGHEVPPVPEPYCWSDQHGVTIQTAGHLHGDESAVVRAGSVEDADLLVVFERDGVETAVLGMGRPRDVMRWRRTRRPTAVPA